MKSGWDAARDLAAKIAAWRGTYAINGITSRPPRHFDWFMRAFEHHLIGIRAESKAVIMLVQVSTVGRHAGRCKRGGRREVACTAGCVR